MCALKEQVLDIAFRHSVPVLPKKLLRTLTGSIVYYQDVVRLEREKLVGSLSFVRTSAPMKDFEFYQWGLSSITQAFDETQMCKGKLLE